MKFSLEWLKYFLDTEASVAELSAKLNAIGIEVEDIEDPAEKLEGFTVAEVLTAKPHPDADTLQVLTVSTGEGDPLTVVAGILRAPFPSFLLLVTMAKAGRYLVLTALTLAWL